MGILDKIFNWSGWDDLSEDFEIYYECELLVDVGDYKKGTEFENIQFDKKRLILYFCNDNSDEPVMTKRFVLEK
jgi:hypothetical protein